MAFDHVTMKYYAAIQYKKKVTYTGIKMWLNYIVMFKNSPYIL